MFYLQDVFSCFYWKFFRIWAPGGSVECWWKKTERFYFGQRQRNKSTVLFCISGWLEIIILYKISQMFKTTDCVQSENCSFRFLDLVWRILHLISVLKQERNKQKFLCIVEVKVKTSNKTTVWVKSSFAKIKLFHLFV